MSLNGFTPGRNFFTVEAFLEDRGGSIKLPLVTSSGPEKPLFREGAALSGAKVEQTERIGASTIPSGIVYESDEILKYTMRGGKTQIVSRVIVSNQRIVNLPHFRPEDWTVQQDVGRSTSPKVLLFLANVVQGSKHLYEYSFESGGWRSVKEMDVYNIDDANWVVGFKRNVGVRLWTERYAKDQVENN